MGDATVEASDVPADPAETGGGARVIAEDASDDPADAAVEPAPAEPTVPEAAAIGAGETDTGAGGEADAASIAIMRAFTSVPSGAAVGADPSGVAPSPSSEPVSALRSDAPSGVLPSAKPASAAVGVSVGNEGVDAGGRRGTGAADGCSLACLRLEQSAEARRSLRRRRGRRGGRGTG